MQRRGVERQWKNVKWNGEWVKRNEKALKGDQHWKGVPVKGEAKQNLFVQIPHKTYYFFKCDVIFQADQLDAA